MPLIDEQLKATLADFYQGNRRLTVLTGAGISAESGIPTFRGPEGYWTVGSKEYHPMEMATYAMFTRQPDEVWKWYLYRRGVCHQADPNPGHLALVEMERLFADRFTLITQNVDGLHLRAGNSLERTLQIHGNVDYMRCAQACSPDIYPIPAEIPSKAKGDPLAAAEKELLRCPQCGRRSRPHVLWFDEYYNEEFYRFHSSHRVAAETDLLLIVGTSGATNLPNQVVSRVLQRGGLLINVDIEENIFARMAQGRGYFLQQSSGQALPELVTAFQPGPTPVE